MTATIWGKNCVTGSRLHQLWSHRSRALRDDDDYHHLNHHATEAATAGSDGARFQAITVCEIDGVRRTIESRRAPIVDRNALAPVMLEQSMASARTTWAVVNQVAGVEGGLRVNTRARVFGNSYVAH